MEVEEDKFIRNGLTDLLLVDLSLELNTDWCESVCKQSYSELVFTLFSFCSYDHDSYSNLDTCEIPQQFTMPTIDPVSILSELIKSLCLLKLSD